MVIVMMRAGESRVLFDVSVFLYAADQAPGWEAGKISSHVI